MIDIQIIFVLPSHPVVTYTPPYYAYVFIDSLLMRGTRMTAVVGRMCTAWV